MKIYERIVFRITLRVVLFISGMNVNVIAVASSCGPSISDAETEPCNLSSGDNLIINKGASINAPKGSANESDPYGLKYSAVNVGDNSNLASKTLVDYIENNGTLQGSSGVTVTYTGSVEKLLNHGTISGDESGAVWVSGQINTLDNDGSINASNDSRSLNAIQIQSASGPSDDGKYGFIGTIKNREKGSLCKGMSHCTPSIDGISVDTATLKTLDNYGILKSQKNNILSNLATFDINDGSNVGTFNNDGTVTGLYHGVLIRGGGYLENLNNNSGSKGITADQDAIQVTGQGRAELDVNPQIRPSKIKQITNASLLYGKKNGIHIDDKGVVDTITNLDGGVIKGDQFSIKNNGTITNDIHNSGAIDGNVELGSARLYMSGPNVTLKGNVSGAKNSVVTIGAKGATTGNLDLTYTHDMNIGTVNILSGSTLRLGDGHNTGSITSNVDNAGSLYFNRNNKVTYNHIISGAGSVHQVGSGTTILTETNTYTGETKIESGTLQLGDKGTAGSIDNTSKVTIGQSGVLAFDRTNPILFAADIEGAGFLHQQGTGDLTLTGNVTTGKPITVTSGKLRFGDGNTIGKLSLAGIDNKGAVVVAGTKNSVVTLDGEISGTGTLEIAGGKAIITSDSNYSGQTSIGNGATLQLGHGGMTGNLTKSDILNKGTLALDLSGTTNFEGVISGNGHIDKIGAGVTRLSSNSSAFTGSTHVEKGTLIVDGQLGTTTSTFNVKNGGTVNGTGIVGGKTTIESGGHLTGKQGDTLTFNNDLILSSGTNVDISLGAEDTSAPALFDVRGNLTLAGTLNVTDLGGLAAGEYDIFHYGGTLTDNGMTFTGGKPNSLSLGTNKNHKVYLINTGGMLLNYWDGGDISKHNNNAIDGGDGIWQIGGNDNWTSKTGNSNASWKGTDQFAIFSGTAGTVQVDNSGGNVTVNGMQFSADGYKITGGSLILENDKTGSAKIRVGTGNKSTAGRVATIESTLTGSATLETTDDGTLVLKGENKYTGGTKVTRGVLQIGDGGTQGSISGDVVTGSKGTLAFDRADAVTFGGNITGEGKLIQNGKGTLALTGTNAHSGGTTVTQGILQIGDGGTQGSISGDVVTGSKGTLAFDRADAVTFGGNITGEGKLIQKGKGTLALTGTNAHSGGTTVTQGILQIGDSGTQGSISGDVVTDSKGTLAFDRADAVTFGGNITGEGKLIQKGKGTLALTGTNAHSGGTTVTQGVLQIGDGGTKGSISGDVVTGSKGTLAFDRADAVTFGGNITGEGKLIQNGKGTLALTGTNAHSGGTTVTQGILQIGDGGTQGSISGDVVTGSKGTLAFDRADAVTFGGNITGEGKLIQKGKGTLALTGTNAHSGGTTVTQGILQIGDSGTQGSISGDVVTDSKGTLAFDRADAVTFGGNITGEGKLIQKGKGTLALTGTNAHSGGTTVTQGVLQIGDGGTKGSISGDVVTGSKGTLAFDRADAVTFGGNITGEGKLIQKGKGTLALTGTNVHSGGTTVTQGVLQIGDGGTKGSISGDVVTGSKGTLAFDRADAVTFGSNITGEGKLIQKGKGTLALTGTNIHSGGTVIRHGILQIGDGHNSGTLTGLVESGKGSKLVFNRADQMAFSGSLKGQGQMVQAGNGTTLLTGINNYTGTTEVQKGTLRQGSEGAFSANSSYTIGQHGKLDMGGFNTTISALNNSGTVLAGGDDKAVGRTLVIAGNYSGNNGIVNLSTVLEGDNSKTDRLVVNGSTSGTTHLVIKNVGGAGAPTTEGIKVVDVKGTSDGIFSLVGDYSYKGEPAVVIGAYAYRLHKNGIDNLDGNWYLRSSLTSQKPNPDPLPKPQQLYHAGVSVYEAYGRVLQTLNMPESLHGRVGGREDKLRGVNSFRTTADEDSADDSTNPSLPSGTWGRMAASYGRLSPRITTSGAGDITYNMARAQIGIDGRLYENDHGSVVGGGFLQYSNINANVDSVHGEGKIRANGYTIGVTGTWYGNNGFYLDGLTQLTYFENDLDSKTASRQLGNNKSALGYALGLEAGQRFDLTPKWSLTPQVQLVHSAINMNDFHDTFGAKIRFDQSRNVKLRVGATIDYSQKWSEDQGKAEKAANLYGLFNLRQELLGRNDAVDVANVAFHGGNDRTWAETGIGGSYNWNDGNSFIYGQTSVNTSLNNFDSYELSAKIGLRMTW
ncbi:autotransporter outer membrane beta-barrel domain-containing protein [Xenorhabdus griffiniae]|uniref:autotransporter-associated beta strand repeat-containing protein n=1 Tax=Xenorhabdus griffiniae TaxID=351672 RepID=UPI0030CDE8A5